MCKYQQTNYECGKHVQGYHFLGSCLRVANAKFQLEKATAATAIAVAAEATTATDNTTADKTAVTGRGADAKVVDGKDKTASGTIDVSTTSTRATKDKLAVLKSLTMTATIRRGGFWPSRKARDAARDVEGDTKAEGEMGLTGSEEEMKRMRCDPEIQGSGAMIRQIRDDGGRCPRCAMAEMKEMEVEAGDGDGDVVAMRMARVEEEVRREALGQWTGSGSERSYFFDGGLFSC